jgi:hypothetical protein
LIYPSPRKVLKSEGYFNLHRGVGISCDEASIKVAIFLQEEIERAFGMVLEIKKESTPYNSVDVIRIEVRGGSRIQRERGLEHDEQEFYNLAIRPEGVNLDGKLLGGQLYGVLTLLQLMDPDRRRVACFEITDSPKMRFRGLRGHLPRDSQGEYASFSAIVRAMAFCRLNQLWIRDLYVRRFPAAVIWAAHPEISDAEAISKNGIDNLMGYATAWNVEVMASLAATADNVWSKYCELIEMGAGESPDLVNIKTEKEKGRTEKFRFGSRFNFCPSREQTYRLLFDLIDEMVPLFSSEIFDLGIDEVDQTYNGSRWGACELCRGKDPVKLFADHVNTLADYVKSKGKIPLINSTPFIKEHAGSFHDIYKSVDLIRKDIVINNWSEKHVRDMQKDWLGRPSKFRSTDYFKQHGFEKIVHLVGHERRWADRPELLESKGQLDCYGAFVAHYSYMTDGKFKDSATIDDIAFSSKHFWNPNHPEIGSDEDERQIGYAKGVIRGILEGKPMLRAIADARKSIAR